MPAKVRLSPQAIEQIKRGAMKTVKAKAAKAVRTVRCPDHGKTAHISHYDPKTTEILVVGCCPKGVDAGLAAIKRALK